MSGQVRWDAQGDAFSLFSLFDPASFPVAELGVYDTRPTVDGSRRFTPDVGASRQGGLARDEGELSHPEAAQLPLDGRPLALKQEFSKAS
ncbi:MAG: hypothetical protein NDJ19_00190 [Ramlibacter sp.]|nr:hypothetical protein [Ramlibacter sp.]